LGSGRISINTKQPDDASPYEKPAQDIVRKSPLFGGRIERKERQQEQFNKMQSFNVDGDEFNLGLASVKDASKSSSYKIPVINNAWGSDENVFKQVKDESKSDSNPKPGLPSITVDTAASGQTSDNVITFTSLKSPKHKIQPTKSILESIKNADTNSHGSELDSTSRSAEKKTKAVRVKSPSDAEDTDERAQPNRNVKSDSHTTELTNDEHHSDSDDSTLIRVIDRKKSPSKYVALNTKGNWSMNAGNPTNAPNHNTASSGNSINLISPVKDVRRVGSNYATVDRKRDLTLSKGFVDEIV
jgi:hypothetical protein